MLIAARIWWVDHKSAGLLRSRTLKPIASIIIESGALYSASLLILLITFLKKSWAKPIMIDLVVQIIVSPSITYKRYTLLCLTRAHILNVKGIAFSLIIVRIGLSFDSPPGGTTFQTRKSSVMPDFRNHQLRNLRSTQLDVQVSHERKARDDSGISFDSESFPSRGNLSYVDSDGAADVKLASTSAVSFA